MDNLISSTLEFLQNKGAQILGASDDEVILKLQKETLSVSFEEDKVSLQVESVKVSGYSIYSVYPKLIKHF